MAPAMIDVPAVSTLPELHDLADGEPGRGRYAGQFVGIGRSRARVGGG